MLALLIDQYAPSEVAKWNRYVRIDMWTCTAQWGAMPTPKTLVILA